VNDKDRLHQIELDELAQAPRRPVTSQCKCPRCNKVLTWGDVPEGFRDIRWNGAHYHASFYHCGAQIDIYGTSPEAIIQTLSPHQR